MAVLFDERVDAFVRHDELGSKQLVAAIKSLFLKIVEETNADIKKNNIKTTPEAFKKHLAMSSTFFLYSVVCSMLDVSEEMAVNILKEITDFGLQEKCLTQNSLEKKLLERVKPSGNA